MSSFRFRAELEEGRTIELVPDYVKPLGVSEIRILENNQSVAIPMYLEADNAIIDGVVENGRTKLKTDINFHQPTTVFALVQGGWLPLPFAFPARFLVDRNVIILLRKIRENKVAENVEPLRWWMQFFSNENAIFNPFPFAFESKYRRKPTFSEFSQAYDEGVHVLREALPGAQVVNYQEDHYRAAYNQLEALDRRNERETRFLQEICPFVYQRVSRRRETEVGRLIFQAADKHRLDRASFVVLAALSCVYEDIHGDPPAIGRQIIKPRKIYSEADAFNALSDLRHIEIAAAGKTYLKNESFTLCTCDRPLALLWSTLAVSGESSTGSGVDITCYLNADLFSRLDKEELVILKEQITK